RGPRGRPAGVRVTPRIAARSRGHRAAEMHAAADPSLADVSGLTSETTPRSARRVYTAACLTSDDGRLGRAGVTRCVDYGGWFAGRDCVRRCRRSEAGVSDDAGHPADDRRVHAELRRRTTRIAWVVIILATAHFVDHAVRGRLVHSRGLNPLWDHSGWPF